ncbi:MAG: hypothetical protein OSJ43_12360 [Oscillospiraceae bacterium]|nr:hypothetical protein [Oscillospiraceae bacterium]
MIYIEREKAYAAISRFLVKKSAVDFTHYDYGRDDAISDVLKRIQKFPAADVRSERYSAWDLVEKTSDGYIVYKCRACGYRKSTKSTLEEWLRDEGNNFCGACGAKILWSEDLYKLKGGESDA